MLRLLKRWLGWEEDSDYFDPEEFRAGSRPRSATAQILANGQRKPVAKPPVQRGDAAPLDFEAEAAEPQFDPYNTGKFDRGASWDRISKNNR
jgi:hypothetical protein